MTIREKILQDLSKKYCSTIELEVKHHSSSVSRRIREMSSILDYKWKELKKDGKILCRYKVWKLKEGEKCL
jgi:hypothetical protein